MPLNHGSTKRKQIPQILGKGNIGSILIHIYIYIYIIVHIDIDV